MSAESEIKTALAPLVASGLVFEGIPPQGTKALPRITYFHVGGVALNFLEAAIPSKKNSRVQINGWASSPGTRDILARQIEDTMRVATSLQVTVLGAPVDQDEPENLLFGSRQDFSLWAS